MWKLAERSDAARRYSRRYRGRLEQIDHLSVSNALRDTVPNVTAGDRAQVDIDARAA